MSVIAFVENSYLLSSVGVATVVYVLAKLLYTIGSLYVEYFAKTALDLRKLGKWAVITGSTDGIGKGMATELAKLGIDVVLVSRNPDKLERVAAEIRRDHSVEVKCIAFDFTTPLTSYQSRTSSAYDVIKDGIEGLEIGILVNNVGMSAGFNLFLDSVKTTTIDHTYADDVINCNVVSMVKMTEMILPGMVQRQRGLVINISSVFASFVTPLISLYSGTKRFADKFSKSLSYEFENSGVIIQCIQPGMVRTNMTKNEQRPETSFAPSYATYTTDAMWTLGKVRMTHGFWRHTVENWIVRLVPEKLMARLMQQMMEASEKKRKVAEKARKMK